MKNIDIPVGISSFSEIRRENYYYVDKSGLIEELLRTKSTKVTLITRPRRFGKTLGMSMLSDKRNESVDMLRIYFGGFLEYYLPGEYRLRVLHIIRTITNIAAR